jgi:hypothetical protein
MYQTQQLLKRSSPYYRHANSRYYGSYQRPAPLIIRARPKHSAYKKIFTYYQYWLLSDKVVISMNRLSLFTVVLCLGLLGAGCFMMGFLIALQTNNSQQSTAQNSAYIQKSDAQYHEHFENNKPAYITQ